MWLARAFLGLMGLAVGLGAFGAHALKDSRTQAQLETWKTATLYVLIHALAGAMLSLLALVGNRSTTPEQPSAGFASTETSRRSNDSLHIPLSTLYLFLMGCILFGGSLYALVLTQISLLGAITPFGGIMFISGWLNLAVKLGRRAAPQHERLNQKE